LAASRWSYAQPTHVGGVRERGCGLCAVAELVHEADVVGPSGHTGGAPSAMAASTVGTTAGCTDRDKFAASSACDRVSATTIATSRPTQC
jgi:hypothetical protein